MEKSLSCKEAFVLSTLAAISVKTDIIDYTCNSLIVITPAGIITGSYVSDQMKETLENDPTYQNFERISTSVKEQCDGASKAILLKDAVLTTNQGIETLFKYLFVFLDDIIALSYGTRANN